jgi:hypothetical protein
MFSFILRIPAINVYISLHFIYSYLRIPINVYISFHTLYIHLKYTSIKHKEIQKIKHKSIYIIFYYYYIFFSISLKVLSLGSFLTIFAFDFVKIP